MLLCKYGIPFRIALASPVQVHSVFPVVKRVPENCQYYSILNNVITLRIYSWVAFSSYSQSVNSGNSFPFIFFPT